MEKFLPRIYYVLFLPVFLVLNDINAQNLVQVPYGSSATINGVVSGNEWNDANEIELTASPQTKVLFKHDSSNFYVAFLGNLQTGTKFPEILLDMNNSKSSDWQSDDWWFHVSATDCEYSGEYGNYGNCQLVRPNWKAEKNFANNGTIVDTVEIQIPFSTMGLTLDGNDSVGISFLTTNTFSSWVHWPADASRNEPGTWGTAVFTGKKTVSINDTKPAVSLNIYPNPSNGTFTVNAENFQPGSSINIYNTAGQLVSSENIQSRKRSHITSFTLPPSVYILQVVSGNVCVTRKIVVN